MPQCAHKSGYAIRRSEDLNSWEYAPDHRGETVYSTDTGNTEEITALGDYPKNTTTIAPLTPYDKWDGEKWVTDTEAQHGAAVEAAEAQRQSLIDAAMASISLIQLKLQAGRKLTQAETTRLNAVLDYIDAVTATDASTAPDIEWPVSPESGVGQTGIWLYQRAPQRPVFFPFQTTRRFLLPSQFPHQKHPVSLELFPYQP